MKKHRRILIIILSFSLLLSCKNSGDNKLSSTDLTTLKTLGLAYLEEFKLEEAEQAFLTFIDKAPEEKLGYANLGLTYLRMGKYPEAEKQLMKGIKIDSTDADIRLILATVYRMNNEPERSVSELKEALIFAPGHLQVLYDLSELYALNTDEESLKQRRDVLVTLITNAPGNLVPYLNLIDILMRQGETDRALEQLEIIKKQFPEFPKEAIDFYNKTLQALRKGEKENAVMNFTIFHNYMKVTSPYQAGIMDLKGPGGSLIGFPVITFDRQTTLGSNESGSILDLMKFTDVTESSGLNIVPSYAEGDPEHTRSGHVEAADFDGDGDIDLYAGSYDLTSSTYKHYLFNNSMGLFNDVTNEAGLRHKGTESAAEFADYDNDGFFDLYIVRDEGDILYKNIAAGKFDNVSSEAEIENKQAGNRALFFDMDHDGDLDLYRLTSGNNIMLLNKSDGTFGDQSQKMETYSNGTISRDAVFGDFDEDEDIDLIVVNENASNIFYSNQRQGYFKDNTEASGLKSTGGSTSITAGDYNNDGFLDLYITSANPGENVLYKNLNNGTFEAVKESSEMSGSLKNLKSYDATFVDFDNDGFLDILIAGVSVEKDGRGIFLFHNDGKANFSDVSYLLPESVKSGNKIAVFDYNDDGDLDIAVAGVNGGLFLLRNDGGNNNHYIKIKLVGLRAGSAKNNHFGIGAKMEMRAGDLYQTMVVSDPNVHFGMGNRSQADIIRITWTNGVPQNIFLPGTDQALIEAQTLKGSCPFLYTWDGDEYVFVKDILWRSALGMPLGIMGGNTAYAFADASDDYIKIPGEVMKPDNGKYTIRITSELWETIYLDKIQLVAVDHPESTEIFAEEQFSPPPFPGLKILQVKEKSIPVAAINKNGDDVLEFITHKDDKYLSGFNPDKYQGITDMQELILDPGEAVKNGSLYIFMNGWIFPTDASINYALTQNEELKVFPPVIQVINKKGEWETVIANLGFPMGKDKTVIANLSGKFITSDHRIRIITNMEIYWDYIFFSEKLTDNQLITTKMDPVAADLHYRGFSESYRKGSRYGPHWFDYSKTETEPKWRDLPGNYTRYGDVLQLLNSSDNKYIISNAGDEASIEFDATSLPALKPGWKRDFLINSVGWVKDGDLNTAFGNSVLPLPFHGMKSYPPSDEDIYPNTTELQKYNREYNTRVVTNEGYLNALKGKY